MQEKNNDLEKHFINTMGKVIKTHREETGKSIYSISAEASVPRSTWRDIEFFVSQNTSITNFCKIAEGLDKYPWDLLKEIYEKSGDNFSFTDLNK